jgi:hypothetical protein
MKIKGEWMEQESKKDEKDAGGTFYTQTDAPCSLLNLEADN